MKEIKISSYGKKHGEAYNYTEKKFVVVTDLDKTVAFIRSTVLETLRKYEIRQVLMASIPLDLNDSSTAIVIIAKVDQLTDEENDKMFLAELTDRLDGRYPKIYYKNRGL